jgi:hypothetical protein
LPGKHFFFSPSLTKAPAALWAAFLHLHPFFRMVFGFTVRPDRLSREKGEGRDLLGQTALAFCGRHDVGVILPVCPTPLAAY